MIDYPVNVALTLLFACTGLYCTFDLFTSRRRSESGRTGVLTDEQAIDLNHVIMSLAMIAMTWMMFSPAVLWLQVAIFVLLALSLIPNWVRARTLTARGDVLGHMLLDLAMVWMLAAMPLLMAGADHDDAGHSGHAGHGGHGGEGEMLATTPAWAAGVNDGFVALSAAVALWWVSRWVLVQNSPHRLHALCHTAMAAGMAVMLVVMNG